MAVESGNAYRFSAYVYIDSLTASGVGLQVRDAGGDIEVTGALFSTVGSWARIEVSVTADATEPGSSV